MKSSFWSTPLFYIYYFNIFVIFTFGQKGEDDIPIIFTLRHNKVNSGWVLPYANNSESNTFEKLLCPLVEDNSSDVTISVSTSSQLSQEFSIKIELVPNFQVEVNEEIKVDPISGPSPMFYYVNLDSPEEETINGIRMVKKTFLKIP